MNKEPFSSTNAIRTFPVQVTIGLNCYLNRNLLHQRRLEKILPARVDSEMLVRLYLRDLKRCPNTEPNRKYNIFPILTPQGTEDVISV